MSESPVLEAERLILREVTAADADWYLRHFSHPQIVQGHGFAGPADGGAARTELQEYIVDLFAEGHGIRWGLCLRDSDELLPRHGPDEHGVLRDEYLFALER